MAFRDILRIAGVGPGRVRSVLDFAGGYGRNLRFIRAWLPHARCVISDIDRRAVDFAARELGVEGLYSTPEAGDFTCDERFDAILVVSLFTHLRPPVFEAWLARLVGLLAPGGLLVVTTHPLGKPRGALVWEEIVPGAFYFTRLSEAEGRLDPGYYGGSLVGVDWMRGAIAAAGGRVDGILPRKISDHDVYLVRPAK